MRFLIYPGVREIKTRGTGEGGGAKQWGEENHREEGAVGGGSGLHRRRKGGRGRCVGLRGVAWVRAALESAHGRHRERESAS